MQFKCVGRDMLKVSMCTLFIIFVSVLDCKAVYALDHVRSHLKVNEAQSAGYTGYGVRVGVFDEGHVYYYHPDFQMGGSAQNRITFPNIEEPFSDPEEEVYNEWNHATMTAGTIGGDGFNSIKEFGTANQWRGMAPEVQIQSYSFGVHSATNTTPVQHEDFKKDLIRAVNFPLLFDGIHIANNSWGDDCDYSESDEYTNLSRFLDAAVTPDWDGDYPLGGGMIIVFGAGNYRHKEGCPNVKIPAAAPFDNYGTLNHPKEAKNIIVVGAIDSSNNVMTNYSNWGPTYDGRIKPDLVATGQNGGQIIGQNDKVISVLTEDIPCTDNDRSEGIRAPIYDDPNDPEYKTDTGTHKKFGDPDYLPYLHASSPWSVDWNGYLLENVTDFSSCIIGRMDQFNVYCDGVLQGGDDNYWEENDEYSIYRQYGCFGETSAAAAAASGAIALLLERFHDENIYDYFPSTIKALLIHTATDLDNGATWYNRGPDYASGYGLVNIKDALDYKYNPTLSLVTEREIGMWGHQMHYRFLVYEGAGSEIPKISATLAWDDIPASQNANKTLYNDLNLTIRDPNGQIYYPWTLDPQNPSEPAVRDKPDHVNNVEQVVVDEENFVEGYWEVIVSTSEGGDELTQKYSLIGMHALRPIPNFDKAIELTANVPFDGKDSLYESNVVKYVSFVGDYIGPEVVHKITTTSSEDIRVELSNSSIHDFFIFSDDDDDLLPYNNSNYDSNSVAVIENAPPGTYYIVVDSMDTTSSTNRDEDYTLTVSLTDEDFDGIHDKIDTYPKIFSDDFDDDVANDESTNGTIIDRGNQYLTITDALSSDDGVVIRAYEEGGDTEAVITTCNKNIQEQKIKTPLGDFEETVTCGGSVTNTVTKGSVEITFFGDNGRTATTTLTAPNTLTFDETTFTLTAPSTNSDSVTVITDDKNVTISPGDSITVFEKASVDINPNTLNLKSKGNWITCYIELPEGYYVGDIDYETMLLENMLPVDQYSIEDNLFIGKFSRKDLIELINSYGLEHPAEVTLDVNFQNNAGTIFEGNDTILLK